MKTFAHHKPCPCRATDAEPKNYGECCAPCHAGEAPSTPEALMRSRYSAYALGLIDYLLATWHPSTSPGELDLSPIKWMGLEIHEAAATGDAGVVEFTARFKEGALGSGRAGRLRELSRFVRDEGRWLYVDGSTQPA